MRIGLLAVGRLKAGAEAGLLGRYLDRAVAVGRGIGIEIVAADVPESREGSAALRRTREAGSLGRRIPAGAVVVAFDENGRDMTSEAFAGQLREWRDRGIRDLALVIGGPDGLEADFLGRADLSVRLGRMTWPHQIARVLVAEQLYRAATILAGHPYHRG